MNKATKKFLNSLKCPICQCQIDLISNRNYSGIIHNDIGYLGINFGCVNNPTHYGLNLDMDVSETDNGSYLIIYESSIVNNIKVQYEIIQHYTQDGHTKLIIWAIDPEGRYKENVLSKSLNFERHLFNFNNTNKENLIDKITTLLLFQ